MKTNNLYCIIGPSGSGKTFLAESLGHSVQSYTTRPTRFEGEKGHKFVTEDTYQYHRSIPNFIVAENIYDGNRYWATINDLEEASCYVVDVPGYLMLTERAKEANFESCYFNNELIKFNRRIIPIYIQSDEKMRFNRCCRRIKDKDAFEQAKNRFIFDERTWPDMISKLYENAPMPIEVFENNTNYDKVGTVVRFHRFIQSLEEKYKGEE